MNAVLLQNPASHVNLGELRESLTSAYIDGSINTKEDVFRFVQDRVKSLKTFKVYVERRFPQIMYVKFSTRDDHWYSYEFDIYDSENIRIKDLIIENPF